MTPTQKDLGPWLAVGGTNPGALDANEIISMSCIIFYKYLILFSKNYLVMNSLYRGYY